MYIVRATGSAAIAATLSPDRQYRVSEVRLHLSDAGGAGDLTISLDANAGSAYDLVLLTQDMTSITDLHWQPTRPIVFDKGDVLNVAWANANTRTFGLEIVYE